MKYRLSALILMLSLVACGGGSSGPTTTATNVLPNNPSTQNGTTSIGIVEYSLGSTPSVGGLTIANDGSIWTQSGKYGNGAFVRRMNGSIATYPVSDSSYYGLGIMTSAGTSVFGGFQNNNQHNYENQIASVPNAGGAAQFYPNSSFPSGDSNNTLADLADMTHLSDGSVWQAVSYYSYGVSALGYVQEVTPGNTKISLPQGQDTSGNFTATLPNALTQGPDGNLWVAEQDDVYTGTVPGTILDTVIRVYSKNGTLLHTYPTPFLANAMVTGPDNAVWFTSSKGVIGRITAAGTVSTYPTNTTTNLGGIAVGSDGALWFLEPYTNMVARISTSGVVNSYAIPTANSFPVGIAGPPPGCAGAYIVWFAESVSGKIAMVHNT